MGSKTILITGGDGGLGQAVCAKLLADDWTLIAAVLNAESKQKLEQIFPDALDKTLFPVVANLSVEEDVKKVVGAAQNSIFGLVHLAGGYRGGNAISDYAISDYDYLMDLNVRPTFLLLKEIVPLLKSAAEGAIVTIGAKPVLHQSKGNALYTASKSALVAITLSVAEECRPFNVRSNVILPATLQTPNNLSWATKEQFNTFTPIEDVAETIAFLMSDKGKGITGVAIPMYNKIDW